MNQLQEKVRLIEINMVDYSHCIGEQNMPTAISSKTYYTAHEVAAQAGISKPTLLRWIKNKRVIDSARRDRNGWRMFTPAEVDAIRKLAQSEK
jgi:hypothetical protein